VNRPARTQGPGGWWLFLVVVFVMGVFAAMLVTGWVRVNVGRPIPPPKPVKTVKTLPGEQPLGSSL
jgi:hypothetical protein